RDARASRIRVAANHRDQPARLGDADGDPGQEGEPGRDPRRRPAGATLHRLGRVTNIRELEGALTRVVAFSSLTGRAMSVELAQDVLKDVFPQGEAAEVSIKRIQDLVAERFSLSLEELCGDKRSQNIVYPRQVAMYLSRELTDSSLPKIGKEFGGRDHTTVIHATSKIARLIREDRSVYNLVQELTARVKQ